MPTADFAIEEYKALRAELQEHVDETLRLERYAVAGIVGFYAWVLTRPGTVQLPVWIWFVPVLLPVAGGFRSLALYHHIGTIARYLLKLEKAIVPGRDGWEAFLLENRKKYRGTIAMSVWLLLLAFTVSFAVWAARHP